MPECFKVVCISCKALYKCSAFYLYLYILQKQNYGQSKFYIVGICIFDLFCSCDLDLNPSTFIYKLDSYSPEIYWLCENELPMTSLSKVVVLQPVNAYI